VAVACSVDNAPNEAVPCTGLNCGGPLQENSPPPTNVPGSTDVPDAAAPPPAPRAKPECGPGICLPDDAEACADHVEPTTPGVPDAGVELDAGSPAPTDAGVGADASVDGPPVDGNFDQPEQPATGSPQFGCQLGLTSSGGVERACGAAGSQDVEEPCTSSLDCLPGLGCVGMARSGRCLPYCCGVGADDTCAEGFYCAERPLRSEALGEVDGPLVPVCARADNCNLGEQEDCTGPRCLCGPDMACKLVRDQMTSCVRLADNAGQAGEDCPCDRGYHCAQADEPRCVKTCDLDEKDADTCGQGVCQASAVLPTGWGFCVAATPEQMTP